MLKDYKCGHCGQSYAQEVYNYIKIVCEECNKVTMYIEDSAIEYLRPTLEIGVDVL